MNRANYPFDKKPEEGRTPERFHAQAQSLARCSSERARALLPYERALAAKVLPLALTEQNRASIMTCAVGSSVPLDTVRELRFLVDAVIRPVTVDEEVLKRAIFIAYRGSEETILAEANKLSLAGSKQGQEGTTPQARIAFRPERGEAAQFLASLIEYAISQSASDLHLVPFANGLSVRVRVHGDLRTSEGPVCPNTVHQQLIARLKVLANLPSSAVGIPLDGAFSVPCAEKQIHVRLSIMPTVHGEKAVLRFLGVDGVAPLHELMAESPALHFLEEALIRRSGAVLLSGSTGSGKSTTLYAAMALLRDQRLNLVTIEDPVEHEIEGVSQTSLHQSLDYACSLRAVLRQDPDVVLLGEIRDADSASVALQAAITGHLLLSTVHARSAADVFLRLESLGVERFTAAQAVELILCQRLVPKLCAECRVFDLKSSNRMGSEIYKAVGCAACDYSGYRGRALVCEALRCSGEVRSLLLSGTVGAALARGADENGDYVDIQSSLHRLLTRGTIDMKHFQFNGGLIEDQSS